jgi:lipid-binding SYLF domain-containing protein
MRKLMFVPAILVAGVLAAPLITASDKDKTYEDKEKKEVKVSAEDKQKAEARLTEAEEVLKASVTAPDQGIPKNLLEKAECVGVFPGVKKGALIVGGAGGKGVFTCKNGNGMTGPSFFKIGGPSIGWQAGVESADLVLLIMNKEGIDKLLTDKFKIGADATAAAGPVGRNTQASTDILMHSQILSWSRSRGLFAGISLEGMVMTQDKEDNAAIYGKAVEAREILTTSTLQVPQVAKSFVKTTEQYVRPVS